MFVVHSRFTCGVTFLHANEVVSMKTCECFMARRKTVGNPYDQPQHLETKLLHNTANERVPKKQRKSVATKISRAAFSCLYSASCPITGRVSF